METNFLKRQGRRILRGVRANALKLVSGGIEIETDGGQKYSAPAVVIADGGFTSNLDMRAARIRRVGCAREAAGAETAGRRAGDGLRMAQALGAQISEGMNNFYGHLHSRDAMQSTKHWPRPVTDDLAAAAIVIDENGLRFTDEALGGIWISNAIARLPDPLGTTIIFAQAIWDGPPGRNHAQPPNPLVVEAGGTLHKAETLAELAGKLGLSPQAAAERRSANTTPALDAGALDKLTPPRRSAPHKAWPIRTAPFYAMPICSAITNTMGGIVVNGDGAVLDVNDKPIPGLYAAGSTVGGLDGGPDAGYVGGLIKAVFALRAAETIAR